VPLIDSKVARDLLLHKLPEEQAEVVAERVVEDEDLADQLELEAIDLLDDLARGVLNAEDAKRARAYLVSDQNGARRLQFAHALAQLQAGHRDMNLLRRFVSRPRYWVPSALAACLLMATVLWLFPSGYGPAPSAVTAGNDSTSQVRRPVERIFTVALLLAESRGENSPRIEVPASAGVLRLECQVPESAAFVQYEVILKDAQGKQVAISEKLFPERAAENTFVAASFPTVGLRTAYYLVSVRATDGKQAEDVVTYKVPLKLAGST
jgi:hypothetical protein